MRIPFLAAALSLCLNPAFAAGWVALQDLSPADYQTAFNRWTSPPYGLRLTCVSAYDLGAGPRYTALWTQQSGPGYYALNGLTADQFNAANSSYQSQGFQPVFISAFTSGGAHYYNGIWEYQPRATTAAEVDLTGATLTGQILAKASQGYTLTYVTTFTDNATSLYAAIWTKGSSTIQCAYGLPVDQYQTQFNTLTAQGYRLTAVTTSLNGTTLLYSAVFEQPFGAAWYNYIGISETNYAGETLNAYYTGYRPTFVSVYTNNNQIVHNATWTYNGSGDPGFAQPIYNAVADYMRTNGVPGLSVAVSRNGRLVFAKGFGLADQNADLWVNPHHRFRIASVSKPFTATAMLRLRDAGTLTSLDDLVFGNNQLLGTLYGTPPYTTWEQAITVRHLLSHTTGWLSDGQLWNNAYGTDHAAIIGWQLDNVDPTYFPGTYYQYQNIDFCVAGRVIEQLSGLTYEQYVQTQVQAPCGITDMELGNQTLAGRKPNEVVYYQAPASGDPYVTIDPHRMDANGGWIARPLDLLLLLRRIDGDPAHTDIISSNRVTEMQTGSSPNPGYGLATILGGSWWGHNGCMDGTISFLVHRNDGFEFAVVCNIRPDNDECAWNLRNAIDQAVSAVPLNAWPSYDLFPSVNPDYDSWTVSQFPAWLIAQPGMAANFWGPNADLDGDGIQNLLEAYFELDPFNPDTLPYKASLEKGDLVVRWRRNIFSSTHGVQLQSVYRTDLQANTWLPGPPIQAVFGPILSIVDYETHLPVASSPRAFERFAATAP
jgi:CubicO group peptidase (beta-lactamase class C family)